MNQAIRNQHLETLIQTAELSPNRDAVLAAIMGVILSETPLSYHVGTHWCTLKNVLIHRLYHERDGVLLWSALCMIAQVGDLTKEYGGDCELDLAKAISEILKRREWPDVPYAQIFSEGTNDIIKVLQMCTYRVPDALDALRRVQMIATTTARAKVG